ncbi:MAG: WD40/YVTN/BNR-like repeat-containing protein, partial [Bacteroidota bacterium]
VLVAAQGPVHGASPDRGVYKSIDGGATWKKTLFVDDNTGISSLSMDMTNPRILYAATWPHRRYPWKVESGPNSAIWKSTDGGETWNKIMEGLPKEMGKIGVSVSRANPNRVYAIIEAEKSKAGLYRSDDGGKKWTQLSSDNNITARSWYYMEVFADPINEDIVYVLNAPMTRSIDGGKTFQVVTVGHGDTHDLWINPKKNTNIALADDGGGEITFNSGKTWSTLGNQPTAQFYRVNVDNRFPYWVYGGQQDNTSVMIKSRTNSMGITVKDWVNGPGCESAYIAFDNPNNPQLFYGGCYQGQVDVLDSRTDEVKDLMEYPATNLAYAPKKMKYRFNWNAPLINSPHDSKTLYHAANVLFKSTNGGISWEKISGDLTRNDSTKQDYSGGPITNEGAGGENYNTIYYVIESPHEKGLIYTGSDCGLVHITKDGGKSWQNVTPAGLPECMIHSIEVSPHEKGTVYLSASRYKFNDYSNMAYKSTDYGKTWTKIGSGIEA